jgi:hypothetical protein
MLLTSYCYRQYYSSQTVSFQLDNGMDLHQLNEDDFLYSVLFVLNWILQHSQSFEHFKTSLSSEVIDFIETTKAIIED